MKQFDLTGPLPQDTCLLEASAGTGKTYAIAALATRFIAERGDLDITSLLLITFGNHAAGELRSRVFQRLKQTLEHLDDQLSGRQLCDPDAVDLRLALGDAATHRKRVAAALEHYNEATIVTTHSFCESMLRELGVLGDWDPMQCVGPDDKALANECASDVYLRYYRDADDPPFSARTALAIGEEACLAALPLLPSHGPHHDFAVAVRQSYAARKATLDLCTFNDVVARLRSALSDSRTGELVRETLSRRFPVVLVDEFQDTDPDQWDIIERAFVGPGRPTVLIGDPKQSIYGFRGADLGSYLRAREGSEVFTLGCNYRSDAYLVQAVTNLFGTTQLGSAEVTVVPVEAKETKARLSVPGEARLWLRRQSANTLHHTDPSAAIERDLIDQVRTLLGRGLTISEQDAERRLCPGDIAVLCRTKERARRLRRTLTEAGVPAVLTGNQSVWAQEAAQDWKRLLRAMSEPNQSNIRMAALTPLLGSELDLLLGEASPEPARISTLVRELSLAFERGGIGAVVTVLRTRANLDARVLAEDDGARRLTDQLHVAELLDATGHRSIPRLLAAIDMHGSSDDEADSIRLESDDTAVRVMTLHAAKGLEFPVVLLPETGGSPARLNRPFSVIEGNRRHLYVGPKPHWDEELAKDVARQAREEELRLLYVGLTRAKHLAIAWHVSEATKASANGPLSQLLALHGSRHTSGSMKMINVPFVLDSYLDQPTPPLTLAPAASPPPALHLAQFTRTVDHTWRRTSYSGLTQGLHESPLRVLSDEAPDLDLTPAVESDDLDTPSPMADLPAGASFGTLVHEALERLDWSRQGLAPRLTTLLAELGPANGLDEAQAARLATALELACTTALHPVTEKSLSDLPISARLPELSFDLPLADHGTAATLAELASLLAKHLPAKDPLADYPRRLGSSEAAPSVLNGFLTGSIDAVLRLDDGRFVVVDYKTNRLSPNASVPLTLGHYTPGAMAEAMMQAHYPLQASLYCVALHRHLTLRLPGYDPERHLGGVGYLFVRGMAGPDTAVVDGFSCGVFGWFPPASFVQAASDLLGGHHG